MPSVFNHGNFSFKRFGVKVIFSAPSWFCRLEFFNKHSAPASVDIIK